MISIKTPMTAQAPSRFALPICAPISGSAYSLALGVAAVAQGTDVAPTVRNRRDAVTGLVKGDFPGSHAWRPPIC